MKIQIGDEVRDMTADEAALYARDVQEYAAQKKAQTDKAAARQTVLDRLGITADEAALLLG